MLRVYDVTGLDFNGANAHRSVDLEISEEANNWYINVWAADRAYCVDLGLRYPDGTFVTLVRSNIVTTPRDSISPVVDEEWMVVDDTFERLYKTAGADEWGNDVIQLAAQPALALRPLPAPRPRIDRPLAAERPRPDRLPTRMPPSPDPHSPVAQA